MQTDRACEKPSSMHGPSQCARVAWPEPGGSHFRCARAKGRVGWGEIFALGRRLLRFDMTPAGALVARYDKIHLLRFEPERGS